MSKKISVTVIGGSGYAGGELLRLLSMHPAAEITHAVSESSAGKHISSAFPGHKFSNLRFENLESALSDKSVDLVFLARDTGTSMKLVPAILEQGSKVIDLAADFRLKDHASFSSWYRMEHTSAQLLNEAVYGLPEINRSKIASARLVANPGCYPTASALALYPLLKAGLVEPSSIIIDAKSGICGAGRGKISSEFHFPEMNENLKPYATGGIHRHIPEIEQALKEAAGQEVTVSFTPHLIPMTRGILVTCYATLKAPAVTEDIFALYSNQYSSETFVSVLEPGALPQTKATCGSNLCMIGISVDKRAGRVIVTAVIDNLIKGASGQAIQNMNLLFGLEESCGLKLQGVWP